MPSTREYLIYVLECLRSFGRIKYRPMMGEFLLYQDGILFGGIYDDRLLIKKTSSNEQYDLSLEIPYTGAKPMYYLKDLDNRVLVQEIINNAVKDLSSKK